MNGPETPVSTDSARMSATIMEGAHWKVPVNARQAIVENYARLRCVPRMTRMSCVVVMAHVTSPPMNVSVRRAGSDSNVTRPPVRTTAMTRDSASQGCVTAKTGGLALPAPSSHVPIVAPTMDYVTEECVTATPTTPE